MSTDATEKAKNTNEKSTSQDNSEAGKENPKADQSSTLSEKQKIANLYKTWEGTEGAKIRKQSEELANRERVIAQQEADSLKRIRQAELDSAAEDPTTLNAVKEKHKREDAEARAQAAETRAQAIEAERRNERLATIAEKAGVDVTELARLSKGDPDTAKDIAQYLPKVNSQTDTKAKPETEQENEEPDLTVIPSRHTGGGDNLLDLSPKERQKERERRLREGKTK